MSGEQQHWQEIRSGALEALRRQRAPRVITIDGFDEGETIQVVIRPVDLEPEVLRLGIGNPVADAVARRHGIQPDGGDGQAPPNVGEQQLLELVDRICQQALVAPTWQECEEAGGLLFRQKLAIVEAAAGRIKELESFRGQ